MGAADDMERAVLELALSERQAGRRRVSLSKVMELPEVEIPPRLQALAETEPPSYIPDDLCRTLNELHEDGFLIVHELNLRQGAGGDWLASTKANPAISITVDGIEWLEEHTPEKEDPEVTGFQLTM